MPSSSDKDKSEDKKGDKSDDKKGDGKKDEKEEKKKEVEPAFEMLNNPARVMRQQLKVINIEGTQYVPMKDVSIGGIIMVKNLDPDNEELVEPVAGKLYFYFFFI